MAPRFDRAHGDIWGSEYPKAGYTPFGKTTAVLGLKNEEYPDWWERTENFRT